MKGIVSFKLALVGNSNTHFHSHSISQNMKMFLIMTNDLLVVLPQQQKHCTDTCCNYKYNNYLYPWALNRQKGLQSRGVVLRTKIVGHYHSLGVYIIEMRFSPCGQSNRTWEYVKGSSSRGIELFSLLC